MAEGRSRNSGLLRRPALFLLAFSARTGFAAHNLSLLKHISLNLIRLDPVKRKGGIKARRLIASTSDDYRAQLLGLT